jgi:hypothetical protein
MTFSYDNNGVLQYEVTFTGDSVVHMLIPSGQVKAAIEGDHSMVSDVSKSGGMIGAAMDKIQTTFQPAVDQIVGVVNRYEQMQDRVIQTRDNITDGINSAIDSFI